MKFISTRVHAVMDYLTAGGMLMLPSLLQGESDRAASLLTAAGMGLLFVSLITRYELGALKLLPTRGHLALDFLLGLGLAGATLMLPGESGQMQAILTCLGLFEMGAALFTQTRSSVEAPAEHEAARTSVTGG